MVALRAAACGVAMWIGVVAGDAGGLGPGSGPWVVEDAALHGLNATTLRHGRDDLFRQATERNCYLVIKDGVIVYEVCPHRTHTSPLSLCVCVCVHPDRCLFTSVHLSVCLSFFTNAYRLTASSSLCRSPTLSPPPRYLSLYNVMWSRVSS